MLHIAYETPFGTYASDIAFDQEWTELQFQNFVRTIHEMAASHAPLEDTLTRTVEIEAAPMKAIAATTFEAPESGDAQQPPMARASKKETKVTAHEKHESV